MAFKGTLLTVLNEILSVSGEEGYVVKRVFLFTPHTPSIVSSSFQVNLTVNFVKHPCANSPTTITTSRGVEVLEDKVKILVPYS